MTSPNDKPASSSSSSGPHVRAAKPSSFSVSSTPALRLLGKLGVLADRTLVAPGADLGGVRIAERLLAVIPEATVIDVGEQLHERRAPWAPEGKAVAGLRTPLAGPAAALASACLQRRYPVEQEAVIIRAVADHLPDAA